MKKELSVKVINNGILLPPRKDRSKDWGLGGVVDNEGNFVDDSIYRFYFGGYYAFNESNVKNSEDAVIYLGHLIPHWGVFFEDFTRRMWYYYKCKHPNVKLAFYGINMPSEGFKSMGGIFHDFLKFANIDESLVVDVKEITRFKTIYVPEMGYDEDKNYCSQEYLLTFDHIINNVSKTVSEDPSLNPYGTPKKIYLSRALYCKNKEAGEPVIEKFFESNGYKIIYQEQLSLLQKVAVFQEAEVVASVEGATAASTLFAPKVQHQIIIRKQKIDCWRQPFFNEMKHVPFTMLDVYYEPIPGLPYSWDQGPFLMLFNGNMKKFAKANGMILPRGILFANINSILHYLHIALHHYLQRHDFIQKAINPLFAIVRKIRK